MLGKTRAAWNVRISPRAAISPGDSPPSEAPKNLASPLSGRNKFVIKLKRVVFPAPLGPISAVRLPSGTSNDACSTARTPRKDFDRPRAASAGGLISLASSWRSRR